MEGLSWGEAPVLGASAGGKSEVRSRVLAARDAEPTQSRREADARILACLLACAEWRDACLVVTYLSFGSEVDTRHIIEAAWDAGKHVALPRCVVATHELDWVEVTSFDGLVSGAHGIEEPPAGACALPTDELPASALALVPGLLFDGTGHRLGYGGGYYDRFLPRFPGRTIGLCRAGQLVKSLSALGLVEPHDVPVDKVIIPGPSS